MIGIGSVFADQTGGPRSQGALESVHDSSSESTTLLASFKASMYWTSLGGGGTHRDANIAKHVITAPKRRTQTTSLPDSKPLVLSDLLCEATSAILKMMAATMAVCRTNMAFSVENKVQCSRRTHYELRTDDSQIMNAQYRSSDFLRWIDRRHVLLLIFTTSKERSTLRQSLLGSESCASRHIGSTGLS